jgi:hypothetical protein
MSRYESLVIVIGVFVAILGSGVAYAITHNLLIALLTAAAVLVASVFLFTRSYYSE